MLVALALGAIALPLRRDAAISVSLPPVVDLASAEFQRAAGRAELCSAANAVGVGLRGEYFANESWKAPMLLERIDSTVNFDSTLEWPADRSTQRPRSVRWKGWIRPTLTGPYRFHFDVPGARLAIAQHELVGAEVATDAHIELAAGRYYPITLEIARLAPVPGRVRLEWTAPHGARYVVPRALLYLPTDSVAPVKP